MNNQLYLCVLTDVYTADNGVNNGHTDAVRTQSRFHLLVSTDHENGISYGPLIHPYL